MLGCSILLPPNFHIAFVRNRVAIPTNSLREYVCQQWRLAARPTQGIISSKWSKYIELKVNLALFKGESCNKLSSVWIFQHSCVLSMG